MKSPAGYYRNIIQPTYQEYLAERTNVRRAILACMVAYHFVDALAEDGGGITAQEAYARLRAECPAFEVIRAVCLAAKHIVAKSADNITIDHISARPPAAWDEAEWGVSLWDDQLGAVIIEGDAPRDVSEALERAIATIRGYVEG